MADKTEPVLKDGPLSPLGQNLDRRAAGLNLTLGEYGTTGLKRYSGYVDEEFLHNLRGQRAVKVYTEMASNDPTIGALLFAIEMLIRQATWDIEAASEDPEDQKDAEFLTSCLDDMEEPWAETISEILGMLRYGWSWHEVVYKIRLGSQDDPRLNSNHNDSLVGWRKFAIRSQDSLLYWAFDDAGDVIGMWQLAPPDFITRFIPWNKSLLFRTKAIKGNPEGVSILRNAYRPWFIKKHIENIEAIGIERDLAGLPVAWVPPEILQTDAPADQKAIAETIKRIVRNIKRDEQEGIVFPLIYDDKGNKQYDLTLLTSGGRRQFNTTEVVNRYDQRIAMTALADFLLLGSAKVGSLALSKSKTEVFGTALGAWLDSIAEVINRHAIPKLFLLNGWRRAKYPRLKHGDIEATNLAELGGFIQALNAAGAPLFPNKELQNHLLGLAGLPTVQESVTSTGPDGLPLDDGSAA